MSILLGGYSGEQAGRSSVIQPYECVLTVEHVHAHGRDLRVGGRAGVAAGVGRRGVLHQQVAGGGRALLRDHGHAAARRVVRYHLLTHTHVHTKERDG